MKKAFSKIKYYVAVKRKGEDLFHIINNSVNSWCADPFIVEYKGDVYIFAEQWLNIEEKGVIAVSKWDGKKFGDWKKIIDEPYHLSFPNVFFNHEEILMCPESADCHQIYLYRAVQFPYKWEKKEILLNECRCVDTCFWIYDGKRYGFTYKINEVGLDENSKGSLYLFQYENGTINFLQSNPVATEDRLSRPAGNCVNRDNTDYRVSQNCEGVYGKALVFSEISFDGKNYSEKIVREINPWDLKLDKRKNVIGCHTYNESENWQVIDVRCREKGIQVFFEKLINKIRRIARNHKGERK